MSTVLISCGLNDAIGSVLYANVMRKDRLKAAMDERGHTQASLAKAIGRTQGTIQQILSGKTNKTRHLFDIARTLGVSPEWLNGHSDEMEPHSTPQPPLMLDEDALTVLIQAIAKVATGGRALDAPEARHVALAFGQTLTYVQDKPVVGSQPERLLGAFEGALPRHLRRVIR